MPYEKRIHRLSLSLYNLRQKVMANMNTTSIIEHKNTDAVFFINPKMIFNSRKSFLCTLEKRKYGDRKLHALSFYLAIFFHTESHLNFHRWCMQCFKSCVIVFWNFNLVMSDLFRINIQNEINIGLLHYFDSVANYFNENYEWQKNLFYFWLLESYLNTNIFLSETNVSIRKYEWDF